MDKQQLKFVEKIENLYWLWLSFFIFTSDQLIKFLVESKLRVYEIVEVCPFLSWTLTYNPGAAFGFLSDESGWQWWFLSTIGIVMSIVLIIWLYRIKSRVESYAIALILGGALGNLYDRLVYGQVVDFILIHYKNFHYPAFNIADSAITIGVFIYLLNSFYANRKEKQDVIGV